MSDTIIPFFKDCAFNPQATQVMGAAYEKACEALHDIGQPDIVKEIIARRIIEVAQTGERDIDRLCERALLALGFRERPLANCTSDPTAPSSPSSSTAEAPFSVRPGLKVGS